MCLRARSRTGCLTSDWWAVFTGAGGLPRTSSPFAAALHLLNSWAGAEPDGQTGTQTSECLCTLRGFLWSSLNGMDVWLFVCAITWIKKKKTCFILIPRIASKTNNTWYSCGTSEHTCTFIYIHPWRLTLSLKGVLLFHPCFIDEETKIRKTCSQFIQLRALNQLVGFCIPEVTLPTVSWKDAIPIN